MPFKTDKSAIKCPFMDNRSKLIPCQKQMIIWWRKERNMSQRNLAKMFGVSRRTIQFILDPKKLKQNLKRREERGGSMQYYDKEEHKKSMKKHRRKKYNQLKDFDINE